LHDWSDRSVDWEGIGDAAEEIGDRLRSWGGIYVSCTKEKWGCACVYMHFGVYRAGYLNYLIVPYQQLVYRLVYWLALRKRPHLRQEIIQGADYPELITKEKTDE
jgi:hypothetical protein